MNSGKKLTAMLLFLGLFVGGSLIMFNIFVKNKPQIKIIAPRTDVNPLAFDSLLKVRNEEKKL